MFIAAAALSTVLAFVFGAGAVGKVTAMRSQVDTAAKLRIDWRRYRLIAVPEAAAAIGLLAGLGIAPSASRRRLGSSCSWPARSPSECTFTTPWASCSAT